MSEEKAVIKQDAPPDGTSSETVEPSPPCESTDSSHECIIEKKADASNHHELLELREVVNRQAQQLCHLAVKLTDLQAEVDNGNEAALRRKIEMLTKTCRALKERVRKAEENANICASRADSAFNLECVVFELESKRMGLMAETSTLRSENSKLRKKLNDLLYVNACLDSLATTKTKQTTTLEEKTHDQTPITRPKLMSRSEVINLAENIEISAWKKASCDSESIQEPDNMVKSINRSVKKRLLCARAETRDESVMSFLPPLSIHHLTLNDFLPSNSIAASESQRSVISSNVNNGGSLSIATNRDGGDTNSSTVRQLIYASQLVKILMHRLAASLQELETYKQKKEGANKKPPSVLTDLPDSVSLKEIQILLEDCLIENLRLHDDLQCLGEENRGTAEVAREYRYLLCGPEDEVMCGN